MFHPQGPSLWELARQALSSTERGYDLLAPKFDYTPFRTPNVVLDAVACQLEELGPFRSGLDLCCGTGAATRRLRDLCGGHVAGLDFSRGMLEVARRTGPERQRSPSISWVRADAVQLPFGSGFDIAVCLGALGHFQKDDQSRLLKEVVRVLRPGGCFATVTSSRSEISSRSYLMATSFNAAMRVRNLLIRPPFIMYYLSFMLPEAEEALESHGFEVRVRNLGLHGRYANLKLLVGRLR